MICDGCAEWILPLIDFGTGTVRCPLCSHLASRRFLPLFVVTGASGVGKTAVIPQLQQKMPDWDIFEIDMLWDSGRDWQMIKCNWLRISHSIHQSDRPVMLCGSILPDQLERCEAGIFFPNIYWLALDCSPELQAQRLRARSSFRNCTEEFIAEQRKFAEWFRTHGDNDFVPPLVRVKHERNQRRTIDGTSF
jgi:hypothetical protein